MTRSKVVKPAARAIARRPTYVASRFEQAGLKPAGSKGFLQNVAFAQRRILEDKSRVGLVRDGQEDVLQFGSDVTINLRADLAPTVEAPLVFAGYGLSAPDVGHDDLAGIDLAGKVAVYIGGTPAAITGALAAHYQQAGVRWNALRAAGAIGAVAIPNPKTMEQPWEQDGAESSESGDDARRSALQRPRGDAGRCGSESGRRRTAVCGIRPFVGRPAGAREREETAAALRASRVTTSARGARLDQHPVRQRRGAPAR